ncbi:serine-rich adhesin for platelets [Anopheles maculipalpis]|uniref:serine-rich adhesin for platelets n=1 Tax=Anopheles maculipalpis TaxID=1496333 RepID=UPI002158C48B|nr:serine-rich adhesin for platelets [Anopheles maculipalpis]
MGHYTLFIRLVCPVLVILSELTSIEGNSKSTQRNLFRVPSRRAPRSALVEENDSGTATNAFADGEMDSYQGLVGRPGIDFPVLTHIPKTIFDCKNHGNGYFADLETRCQVFHICDDGKKISFLCPNGTIFRQLDLICDWWFKVDCAATPNHFAESTEMLTQAKRARLQSKHPVPQPITQSDERLTLNIQDKRLLLGNTNNFRNAKTPARNTLELNRRMDRIVSAESNGFGSTRNGKTLKDNTDKTYSVDEIQDTAQSASFASIANKMFNTYYAQEQLLKDQTNVNKLRRTESNGEDSHRDYLSALSKDGRDENISSSSSSSSNNNRHAMNYMPYTTARKLNLNSKVTQFYTPTVPTFTTSTRTTTVGAITEDAMVTTKATTINGFISGGPVGSQSFSNQFTHPIRREGTADEETIMDHAMEIMQTIKNLKIDESASNGDAAKQTIDEVMATASTNTFNGPSITFSTIASPAKTSFEFLQQPSGIGPNIDRFRRMRIVSERRPQVDVGHRSLLTRTTLNEYDRLFQTRNNENGGNHIDDVHGHDHDQSETEFYMDSQMEHDLEGQSSRYPVFGMSNSTQIRELAQIFTHALSAYLQDPVTFRRILTEIRPKAPGTQTANKSFTLERSLATGELETNVPSLLETTTYSSVDNSIQNARLQDGDNYEVLDFSDLSTTTTTGNPSEKETTVLDTTTTLPTTTVDSNTDYNRVSFKPEDISRKQGKSLSIKFITNSRNELADEVNSELGTPASFSYTNRFADQASAEGQNNREAGDVTSTIINRLDTKAPTISSALPTATANAVTEPVPAPQSILKPPVITSSRYSAEIKPKTTLVLEDDEQLQRAQSESIVSSQNNRPIYERNKYSVISLHNFRDNPTTGVTSGSLGNQTPIATVQPAANSQQEANGIVPLSRTTMSYTVFFDPLTINDELMELEKPKPTAAHIPAIHMVRQYGWNGTLLKPDASTPNVAADDYSTSLMSENLRENSTLMQKKANEMFGELNDAQADKLMSAIKMADKDKSMRRLILLLIRTCDDTPTSTNEESRKALLEALINIGGVMNTQSADDLRIISDSQTRDADYRRGKEIGYNRDTNLLYAGSPDKSTTPNMAATTENYAKVLTGSNDGSNSEEPRDSQERFNSEEWLKGNDVQTTEATTKMSLASGEGQTNYLPNTVTTQARWAYDYDNTNQPQSTTTPYPSTVGQTTVDSSSSTVFTTNAEPTVTTTLTANPTSESSDNPSSTAIQTTVDAIDTEYRSVESLESDSSSEIKPPFVVSQRLPKDLSSSLGYPSSKKSKHNSAHNSDTRALELLKSLYSLAARWG